MGYITCSESSTDSYLTARKATGKLIKKVKTSQVVAIEMLDTHK